MPPDDADLSERDSYLGNARLRVFDVLTGDPRRYYRALRENAVGDMLDAPFCEGRVPAPPIGLRVELALRTAKQLK